MILLFLTHHRPFFIKKKKIIQKSDGLLETSEKSKCINFFPTSQFETNKRGKRQTRLRIGQRTVLQ